MTVALIALAFFLGIIIGTILRKPVSDDVAKERSAAFASISAIEYELTRLYCAEKSQSVFDTLTFVKTVRQQWTNRIMETIDVRTRSDRTRPTSPRKSRFRRKAR